MMAGSRAPFAAPRPRERFSEPGFTSCLTRTKDMEGTKTTLVTAMFVASITRHIREAAKRFVGADNGTGAVIFTIAAIPVIGFVGAAIDYSRANMARSSMQAALDSTALMLSKDLSSGKINSSQIQSKATAYFTALYTNKDATASYLPSQPTVTATYTANNGNLGNTIALTGTGMINTDFMK